MSNKDKKLTREELARREIASTAISSKCAKILVVGFLLVLFLVSVVQVIKDRGHFYFPWHSARKVSVEHTSFVPRVIEYNRALIKSFEDCETNLDKNSWLTHLALPKIQAFLTSELDLGNEKVLCGRKDNLFYKANVDYVTGAGFLEPKQMHLRKISSTDNRSSVEPNPLPEIIAFSRELEEQGIHLIVIPVSTKSTIQPKSLYKKYPKKGGLPDNPSYETFISEVQNSGVDIFDCRKLMLSVKKGAFLKRDTHWNPKTVDLIAKNLADKIKKMGVLPKREAFGYTRYKTKVANSGDLVEMLFPNLFSNVYDLERVEQNRVLGPDKQLWVSDHNADILLLGDSFVNIFSTPSLNWGYSAGFAEQLSFYLQRPIDRISFNDNGSYVTRRELSRRQSLGKNPLKGKKIVIWEFAVRELKQGDWKLD